MDKTKELLKSLSAQLKAEAVIESCNNPVHCIAAIKYVDLYFQRFQDIDTYGFLMKQYIDKSIKLKHHI